MKKLLLFFSFFILAFASYADEQPQFPGGLVALDKYIAENTNYPPAAKENYVEGIVIIGFMVSVDGSLYDIKVLKFVDPDLENEALRVVKGMPAWIPAEKDGQPIEAPAKVNIPFLQE